MLTVFDIVTASGKYPDRYEAEDFTPDVLANIQVTKSKINLILYDLGIRSAVVSSGFRPRNVNEKIATASKKSAHLLGQGVDLEDPKGSIKNAIVKNPHLLAKHGLWMEAPEFTPGWCHLDWCERPERLIRIFKP